jgi:hypothetical protein
MSEDLKVTAIATGGRELPSRQSLDATYTGDDADFEDAAIGDVLDQWKQPVRCATTGNVTIATALNAGDVVDGVTLAAGDRVLVKNQGTASQNGIYVAGAAPVRAADMDDDLEVLGAVVYVIAGATNAGTVWTVTNTAATVVDTDAITWAALEEPGLAAHLADTSDAHDASAVSIVDAGGYFTGTDVEAALQELGAGGGGGGVTVADEGTPLATAATTLDFVGAGVTASGTGATKTITIPGGSGSGDLVFITETVLGSNQADITITGIPTTYRDLVLVASLRSTKAALLDDVLVRFGSGSIDTGSNYTYDGNYRGSAGGSTVSTSASFGWLGICPGASITSGYFSSHTLEVIDYASTARAKMSFGKSAQMDGTNRYVCELANSWRNTSAAIDQVRLWLPGASNYLAGSRLALYGRG